MKNMPNEMPVRFSLYEAEDEQLIQYLRGFRGQDRNRRIRALMRVGLVALQGGTAIAAAPLPMTDSESPGLDPENVEYVKSLGLDPLAFHFADTGIS
jgi:hypothetical protein